MKAWRPPLLAACLSLLGLVGVRWYAYETCNGLFGFGFRRAKGETGFGCLDYLPNDLLFSISAAFAISAVAFLILAIWKLVK